MKTKKPRTAGQSDEIEKALEEFPAFRNRFLRWMFEWLPLLLGMGSMLVCYFHWQMYQTIIPPYVFSAVMLIASFLVAHRLLDKLPHAFRLVWQRRVLTARRRLPAVPEDPPSDLELHAKFAGFLRDSADLLNSRREWVLGCLGLGLAAWILFLVYPGRTTCPAAYSSGEILCLALRVSLDLLNLLMGFAGGIAVWKVLAVIARLRTLSAIFDFKLQIDHPDKCGGLRPLGDLCVLIATVLSPVVFLIAGWLVFFLLAGRLEIPIENARRLIATLQGLLILAVFVDLLAFYLPLAAIRRTMLRARQLVEVEMNDVTAQIRDANTRLLSETERLTTEQSAELEQKLEFLKRVYDRNIKIPTWPIALGQWGQVISTNFVPLAIAALPVSWQDLVKAVMATISESGG